jgi:hypothetical protein
MNVQDIATLLVQRLGLLPSADRSRVRPNPHRAVESTADMAGLDPRVQRERGPAGGYAPSARINAGGWR